MFHMGVSIPFSAAVIAVATASRSWILLLVIDFFPPVFLLPVVSVFGVRGGSILVASFHTTKAVEPRCRDRERTTGGATRMACATGSSVNYKK